MLYFELGISHAQNVTKFQNWFRYIRSFIFEHLCNIFEGFNFRLLDPKNGQSIANKTLPTIWFF